MTMLQSAAQRLRKMYSERHFMRSVILDVDGTLWDATENIALVWRDAARDAGLDFTVITADALRSEFGRPLYTIGADLFPDVPSDDRNRFIDRACALENARLLELRQPLYEGVADTLKTLSDRGVPLVILSNCQSGYIEALLDIHELRPFITGHLCNGDNGLDKASNIRLSVEKWHLPDPVYVGDTTGDMESARAAGIPFAFASYGYGTVADPDYILKQPSDLLRFPDLPRA